MAIKTNQELARAVNEIILQSGIKKTFISEKLGISRQALDKLLDKKPFSLEYANKILSTINYSAECLIKKCDKINIKWLKYFP